MEVTPVMRGCAYEPEGCGVTPAVEEALGFAEMPVVSFYAGKIVAALDRQHPRDFFDVRQLMANEVITDTHTGHSIYRLNDYLKLAAIFLDAASSSKLTMSSHGHPAYLSPICRRCA